MCCPVVVPMQVRTDVSTSVHVRVPPQITLLRILWAVCAPGAACGSKLLLWYAQLTLNSLRSNSSQAPAHRGVCAPVNSQLRFRHIYKSPPVFYLLCLTLHPLNFEFPHYPNPSWRFQRPCKRLSCRHLRSFPSLLAGYFNMALLE